ncbi:Domain of unknown function (DUF23 [Striga hermonthica]|uniref:Glycosyltransferase family 92 protein n=1 Tax=Striga hermonthica TaxID=68872 RepID=A0A9N7N5W7_STRHE|nr:Domain of unknown function (DUF23 [Striga hermonthica]
MKDRKKRTVLSCVLCLWCTIVILCFAGSILSTLGILFTGGFQPALVTTGSFPATEAISEYPETPSTSIDHTVMFPDEALVFLKYPHSSSLFTVDAIKCVYNQPQNSSSSSQPPRELSPSSVDFDHDTHHQIVRCSLPTRGEILSLAVQPNGNLTPGPTYNWDSLAYEATIDGDVDNTTVVFVKGLNLRSGRAADPSKFKCVYGQDLTKSKLVLQSDAVSVAQEIVRCKTPLTIIQSRFGGNGIINSIKVSVRAVGKKKTIIDSVARVSNNQIPKPPNNGNNNNKKLHEVCVCTMLRNQARFLPEWIMYHARIGVESFFIYDNNSDDHIELVVDSLVANSNHNITRRLWPWIKTQEAGFGHCALMARDTCKWIGFIDVDEFLHFPSKNSSLRDFVQNHARPSDVAELRIPCHNFGPSGLTKSPERGVSIGYTCRLAVPERHKSIVRPEALDSSLINMVHHFGLKPGFRHENVDISSLVINHYKYQVWEVFKEKFKGRVATYVSDWQQETNVGSKDRAPGLGTKAVEPPDWSTRFCEVKDTRLRDRVLTSFEDPNTGLLPWEDLDD